MNVQKYHNHLKSSADIGNENKCDWKMSEDLFNCAENVPNGYKCLICNFQCDLKVDLFNHSVQVHNLVEIKGDLTDIKKKFNCKNCNFQTYSFLIFYKHQCKPWELKIEDKSEESDSSIDQFTCASILEPYKCTNCDFCTNLKILLNRHSNQVHKTPSSCNSSTALHLQKKFTCAKCTWQTSSILVLYKHVCTPMKSVRNEKQIMFECEMCNFKTKWRISLQRHSRVVHSPGKSYKCKHCDRTFSQIIHLKTHLSQVHSAENEKPFHCEHCEYKSKHEYSVSRHLKLIHGIDMCFKCEHCKSGFTRKSLLKNHIIEHHTVKKVKYYQCDYCEYTTKCSTHVRIHMLRLHTNNLKDESHHCKYCEYETELRSSLIRHLELVHSVKNSLKWFNCVYCEDIFLLRSEFKKHMSEQHSIGDKPGKQFHCEHCGYKTQHLHSLKTHMFRKHTDHQNVNWIQCEHCEDKFPLKSNMNEHLLKVHSNRDEGWRHCDQCKYKTPFKFRLNAHILNKHTDDREIKWFPCEHCAFKTKVKIYLKHHILRKHTPTEDIKWIKCNLCPFMGKVEKDLKTHIRRKHKEEDKII